MYDEVKLRCVPNYYNAEKLVISLSEFNQELLKQILIVVYLGVEEFLV